MPAAAKAKKGRAEAVNGLKRGLILEAARRVFERDGLEGASLRGIAAEAGYTPAALYFHFDSKEAIYAEVLEASLSQLQEAVAFAVEHGGPPRGRLRAAALAFFAFYAGNPRDLDLGFYLFRGGIRPKGVGRERDGDLNAALAAALLPIGEAAEEMGASQKEAALIMADAFAHAAGLLLLAHTGRMKIFGAAAPDLMERYIDECIARLERSTRSCGQ
jgi:AcrR family transcriptional regulator